LSPKAYSSSHHQPRKTTTNSIKSNFAIKILFYGLFNNQRQKFLLLKNVVVSLEFGNFKGSTTFMTETLTTLKFFLWQTKMGTKAEFYAVKLWDIVDGINQFWLKVEAFVSTESVIHRKLDHTNFNLE
jgi:hypothetical protein